MGYDADLTKKTGKYYLKINKEAPFCGKSLFFTRITRTKYINKLC